MNRRLPLFFIAVAQLLMIPFISAAGSLVADTIETSDSLEQNDVQAIRDWINTKRQVSVKELGGNLSISGEVRAELQKTGETLNGVKQRGRGAPNTFEDKEGDGSSGPFPSSSFDIEVNVMLDYRGDYTWSAIKLEFDNAMGIFGGTAEKIRLEKAYFGVHLIDKDTYAFDVEMGRRGLSTVFDSKLEFNSLMDGILFRYDYESEKYGDLYAHAGAFIIDERRDQFGYIGELGWLDIANSGFYTKYSVIDWDTKHFDNKIRKDRFSFIVSQLILGYKFLPKKFQKPVTFYLAGLWNHLARHLKITNHKRANWGAYAGFTLGELRKKGDWAFDANYQALAAQAVPDFDVSGISLGNAANSGFFTNSIRGRGGRTTRKTAAGKGNYRGFSLTLDYLLTSNLNLQQQWQQTITLDDSIGPFRRFKQYEIEFIYAW